MSHNTKEQYLYAHKKVAFSSDLSIQHIRAICMLNRPKTMTTKWTLQRKLLNLAEDTDTYEFQEAGEEIVSWLYIALFFVHWLKDDPTQCYPSFLSGKCDIIERALTWEIREVGVNPSSVTHWLCNFKQIIELLWGLHSLSCEMRKLAFVVWGSLMALQLRSFYPLSLSPLPLHHAACRLGFSLTKCRVGLKPFTN